MFRKHRHYGYPIILVSMFLDVPVIWLDLRGWTGVLVNITGSLIVFLGLGMVITHAFGTTPCDRCFDRMPPDGTERAQKRLRALRAFHWLYTGSRRILWCLSGIMLTSVVSSFLSIHGVGFHTTQTVIALSVVALLLLEYTHERLHPWCPFCRNGGGDDEETPTPVIDPAMSR